MRGVYGSLCSEGVGPGCVRILLHRVCNKNSMRPVFFWQFNQVKVASLNCCLPQLKLNQAGSSKQQLVH